MICHHQSMRLPKIMMIQSCVFLTYTLLLLRDSSIITVSGLITIQTKTRLVGVTKSQAFDFLATPANWPKIVLSSVDVDNNNNDDTNQKKRMRMIKSVNQSFRQKGETVNEIFGLPPIIPLSVTWTCIESSYQKGILDVISTTGLPGIASNCRMLFIFKEEQEQQQQSSSPNKIYYYSNNKNNDADKNVDITLTMEYQPDNILAKLAIPVLTIDNALALKVLLPKAINEILYPLSPINQFRQLMGRLYGIAGILHFTDLILGQSQLLTSVGCPTFYNLPIIGQTLALLWCAAGPIAWFLTTINSSDVRRNNANTDLSSVTIADIGLFFYGVIEVALAALTTFVFDEVEIINPLINALGVQSIVIASWLYSSKKTKS